VNQKMIAPPAIIPSKNGGCMIGQAVRQHHDDREDHGGGSDDRGANQHGLGRGLEGVAGAVVLLQQLLGPVEVDLVAVLLLDLFLGALDLRDLGELEHALCVVRHGAVGIDGDRDRTHAEEAEGDQAEREHGRRHHQCPEAHPTEVVGGAHQDEEHHAHPEGAEVARGKAGQDVERRTTFARGSDDFLHVTRRGAGEHLDQLGDHRARERPARDDAGELPPEVATAEILDQEVGHHVRGRERDDGREPDQPRERMLEVHLGGAGNGALLDRLVHVVGDHARDDHHHAHGEDPDQELDLNGGFRDREEDERDQRDAGHAVGLEAVGARTDRVTGVVTRAVRDDAGVPRVVLLHLEHDLHQVRPDVCDLGEDAARDAQRGGAQRLADGEADEARPRVVSRHEQQDPEHQQELHADQQHADAHAGFERDRVDGVRLALEAGEGRARVGVGVDADAEPGDAVAPQDADHAEDQDDDDALEAEILEEAVVDDDHGADEDAELHDELALLEQVRLAGLPDDLGNVGHRLMHGQILDLIERHHAEHDAERGDDQTVREQGRAAHPEHLHGTEVRQHQARFTTVRLRGRERGNEEGQEGDQEGIGNRTETAQESCSLWAAVHWFPGVARSPKGPLSGGALLPH
jgi:hypothetical protein